jgi:hypothetical protein
MASIAHADDLTDDAPIIETDGEAWGLTTHLPGCKNIPTDGNRWDRVWADAGGWLCSCIDVTRRDRIYDRVDGDSIDPPEQGDGTGQGQLGLEAPRWTKVGDDFAVVAKGHSTGDTVTVTAKSGKTSEVKLGEKVKAHTYLPDRSAPEGYRWKKEGDEWLVTGPKAERGDRITIAKRDGSTADAVVVGFAGTDLYRVERADAAPAATQGAIRGNLPTAEQVPAGHYALPSSGHNDLVFYRVDRPEEGTYAGRVFVKMIVGGKPEARVEWGKVASILERIAEAGADEAMALYGREIGRCGHCNRTLTDEKSRELGLGPDCRKKLGLVG